MLPKFFNMIAGFGFDYMHGILLCMSANFGLTLSFTLSSGTWEGTKNKSTRGCLPFIKPPVNITRPPRSIRSRKFWKVSEFRYFLLFYTRPCLKLTLPWQYLEYLLLLLQGSYCLLKDAISPHDIDDVPQYICWLF